jgi:hypothetical protein
MDHKTYQYGWILGLLAYPECAEKLPWTWALATDRLCFSGLWWSWRRRHWHLFSSDGHHACDERTMTPKSKTSLGTLGQPAICRLS